ncbi:hypothetical protein ACFL2X_05745 [Candidatus Latescibacterota bacterium]
MLNNSQLPPKLIARAIKLWFQGRIHFVKDFIGVLKHDENENFKAFRKVVINPSRNQTLKPKAIFMVRFQFTRFSTKTNSYLSLIPIPFIVAQPGFRSKTWMIGQKTGAFKGVYEWDSIEDAENYWTSFPMKLMKNRAVPETLIYEIKKL